MTAIMNVGIEGGVKLPVTRTWQAAGLASLIEVLLVAAVLYATHTVPLTRQTYTPLVIEPVVEEIKPQPRIEPPPTPTKLPEPVKAAVEPPRPVPVVREVKPLPVVEPVLERSTPTEFTDVAPPPQAVSPQSSTAAQPVQSEDPSIAYNAALTAAVQAAFRVPASAVTLGFKGRARVEFKLLDGHVSAIGMVQSSTLGVVDRAALRAVAEAVYPPPPPALAGIAGTYQIWVECR